MVVWWPSNWRICIPLLASMVILTAQLSPLYVQNCNRSEVTGHLALVGTHEDLSMSFSGGDAQIKWMPVHDLVIDPLWFQEDQCYKTGLAKLTLTGLPLIKMSDLKLLQYLEGAKAHDWLMQGPKQRSLCRGSREQCWDNLDPWSTGASTMDCYQEVESWKSRSLEWAPPLAAVRCLSSNPALCEQNYCMNSNLAGLWGYWLL